MHCILSDTWHVRGVNILSKFQLPSSYRLWFMILWRYFRKRLTKLINESVTRMLVEQPRLHRVCQKYVGATLHGKDKKCQLLPMRFFLGLSFALRSHDQFNASHRSTLLPPLPSPLPTSRGGAEMQKCTNVLAMLV